MSPEDDRPIPSSKDILERRLAELDGVESPAASAADGPDGIGEAPDDPQPVVENEAPDPDDEAELKPDSRTQQLEGLSRQELIAQVLKAKADFSNYQRRMKDEQKRVRASAEAEVLRAILPVIDDFDRALGALDLGHDALVEGLGKIREKIDHVLTRFEVHPIEAAGSPFDPQLHEAMLVEESSEHEPNTCLVDFERGYTHKGMLLRASKVKVSRAPAG